MDRALKERVVGAIVLVVFIVLVVPVFLDGPAEDVAVVSESVTLPGQNGQTGKRQTIVLERDRTEPVPVSAAPRPEVTDAAPADEPVETVAGTRADEPATRSSPAADEPVQQAAAPVADEPPADRRDPPPAPAAQSATGMWAVQLGSFSNKDNAERLATELRGKGYAAFLSQLSSASGQLHRVRVGPQKDRSSAEDIAAQLARGGHRGQVVPHP